MNRRDFALPPRRHVASAQDARQIIAESENHARAKSQRYEGTLEVIGSSKKVRIKRWEYWRIGSFGASKAMMRFTAPAEVKGVALLVVNHPDRASDQWMWTPAIGRDRRIAQQDRSTRFFGTDFSFEDLEERDVDQFDYRLMGNESLMAPPAGGSNRSPSKRSARSTLRRSCGFAKITMLQRNLKAIPRTSSSAAH